MGRLRLTTRMQIADPRTGYLTGEGIKLLEQLVASQQQVDEIDGTVDQIDTSITAVEARVTVNEADIDAAETRLDTNEGEIDDLQAIQIIAGSGLDGGGDLSGPNRTINMGSPSTVTASSTNAVTDSSHSHALSIDADDIDDSATSNKFTTAADISKLAGIEAGATADQTGPEIKALYEAQPDTNAFTDAEQSKLSGIETGADVTDTANVNAALEWGDVALSANSVETLTPPHGNGIFCLTHPASSVVFAQVAFRVGSGNSCTAVGSIGGQTVLSTTIITVGGATASRVTITAYSDGLIYIVNSFAASMTLSYRWL